MNETQTEKPLARYTKKRDFSQTPEPAGGKAPAHRSSRQPKVESGLRFVVQKHNASRLHYDFRLELDGVLKSWAVPKGPSANPSDRRLAVMVEDHPLEYGTFEGVIPKGEYGGGEVIVWDNGLYAPLEKEVSGRETPITARRRATEAARKGLEAGKLSFILSGSKLQGSWALVRTSGEKNEWLLLKHNDGFADADRDMLAEDRSVISGRTVEDVRAGVPAKSESPATKPQWPTVPPDPMLASLVEKPFSREGWVFEPKLDGMRVIAFAGPSRAELYSRRGNNVSRQFPGLTDQLSRDYLAPVVLDGEVVAPDSSGAPSFQRLQQRLNLTSASAIAHAEHDVPVVFYVFDILWADGKDLRAVPLTERKEILTRRLVTSAVVRPVAFFEKVGEEAYRSAIGLGYEGIIAKRADSRYESGKRSASWLKVKSNLSDDFVIGGYTPGQGRRNQSFGALLLGQFDEQGHLRYTGRAGTGFDESAMSSLLKRLHALEQKGCPFEGELPFRDEAVWVRPELVAEVKFMSRTRDGLLRAPVFLGLREDKPPEEAHPAKAIAVPKARESDAPADPGRATPSRSKHLQLVDELRGAGDKHQIEIDGHDVSLTNLSKPLWPALRKQPAITKRDLIAYLIEVSPYLLPHTKDRPITLTRYPDGVTGKTFYQRHWEHTKPPFLETVKVYSEHNRSATDYLLCNNLATLVWLGQIADLEIHTWFSRIDPSPDASGMSTDFHRSREAVESSVLNYPDFIAFDLDPYTYSGREEPGTEPELNKKAFQQVCRVATRLKEMLDSLGLPAYLKTSGKTGLHVYVPIIRRYTFETTRAACETIGSYLMKANPKDITMTWATNMRTGKVFFDHNMNARSKTVASIYSPRAVGGAGVSTPLRWEELDDIWPLDLNLRTVPGRIAELGDLWHDILEKKDDLAILQSSLKGGPGS